MPLNASSFHPVVFWGVDCHLENWVLVKWTSLRHGLSPPPSTHQLHLPELTAHSLPRCLKTPLEILSITNCLLSEMDLRHLAQNLNVSQLKDLSLTGVNLTTVSSEPLRILLERACATLQYVDLDECGIMDSELTDILPVLSRCYQLTTLSFCGNPISMSVLEDLMRHTIGLSNLTHVLYPTPLESYEDVRGTLHLGLLAELHAKLRQMLQELGRPSMIWFSANRCSDCGDRTLYDPDPILCPCYMSV